MKQILLAAALGVASLNAQADPGYMVGISYALDGQASVKNLGFTGKVLTSDKEDKEDKWVGAAGVSVYPWVDRKLGLDIGGGYNFDRSAAIISYDFLQAKPQISGGWSDTDR